jgi:hypothetical protein
MSATALKKTDTNPYRSDFCKNPGAEYLKLGSPKLEIFGSRVFGTH